MTRSWEAVRRGRTSAAIGLTMLFMGGATVVTPTSAHAADVSCDGSRKAASAIAERSAVVDPVGSVASGSAEIKLRYSSTYKCAWGWIGEPDDDGFVWVDRSTDGGITWESGRADEVEIADRTESTFTRSYAIGIPTPWNRVRACGYGFNAVEVLGEEVQDDILGQLDPSDELAPFLRPGGGIGRGGGGGKTVSRNGKKYRVVVEQTPADISCTNWFDPDIYEAGKHCGPFDLSAPGFAASGFAPAKTCALGPEAADTLARARRGGPFPFQGHDHTVWVNRIDPRLGRPALPVHDENPDYYREYTSPTPGVAKRGERRFVLGAQGEMYFTFDHYDTFYVVDHIVHV